MAVTRARPAQIDAGASAEPVGGVSAPKRPSAIDAVPDAGARAILEEGGLLAIGPDYMAEAGPYVMAARWDGQAFKVFDGCGDWRGTFASWPATDRALAALGDEWNAFVK